MRGVPDKIIIILCIKQSNKNVDRNKSAFFQRKHFTLFFLKHYINLLCRLRVNCHWLCNHPYFGNVVLLCIMVSSAMLAAEDPLDSNSERNKVLIEKAILFFLYIIPTKKNLTFYIMIKFVLKMFFFYCFRY